MTEQLTPRYAHLDYHVLHELDITIAEYFLLDMIYRISGNGSRFAQKRLDNIAFDMNMSKKGVILMRDRLIEKKLLIKGSANKLRTSEKVHKVYFLDEDENKSGTKYHKKVNKLPRKVVLSSSKTSVENNLEINSRLTKEQKTFNKWGGETVESMVARLSKTATPTPGAWVDYGKRV